MGQTDGGGVPNTHLSDCVDWVGKWSTNAGRCGTHTFA